MTRPSNSSDLTDLEWLLLEPLMPAPQRLWAARAVWRRAKLGTACCTRGTREPWVPAHTPGTLGILFKDPQTCGFAVLPQRGIVERNFAWLGRRRRLR